MLLIVLGLIMVYSSSMVYAINRGLGSSYFFSKQLVAALVGGVLLVIAARMPVKLHRALAYPIIVGSVALMALVQVPGIGQEINGNTNWISLGGPFQIQPSEFGKLALVLWGADLLARKQERRLLAQWKHLLVPLVPATFILLGLIMLGGDMGTAVILTAILFGLLWVAGCPHPALRLGPRGRRRHRRPADLDQPQPHGAAQLPGRDRQQAPPTSASSRCTAATPLPPADSSVPVSARVWKNGVNCRKRTPTSSSPSPGRNSASPGHCRYSRSSRL